jgi:hypothetical protein
MNEPRFTLGWDRPVIEGAATHVTLYDGGVGPLYVVASGHGSDDASALRDLYIALNDQNESADKIAFVTEEYEALRRRVNEAAGEQGNR